MDPDQTPQNAASDQGLYCLLKPVCILRINIVHRLTFLCVFICFEILPFFHRYIETRETMQNKIYQYIRLYSPPLSVLSPGGSQDIRQFFSYLASFPGTLASLSSRALHLLPLPQKTRSLPLCPRAETARKWPCHFVTSQKLQPYLMPFYYANDISNVAHFNLYTVHQAFTRSIKVFRKF